MTNKVLFYIALATIAVMVQISIVSIWAEVWLGKPLGTSAVILAGSVSAYLVSLLFNKDKGA